MNLKYLLTTFIFDFAGLGIIWIFSEIHRTGHVIVDSENIENCFNLFDIIINTSLVFLINFCSVLVCRYFKIDKNEIFLEKFLNQLFSLWLYQQWSLKLYRSNFCRPDLIFHFKQYLNFLGIFPFFGKNVPNFLFSSLKLHNQSNIKVSFVR